MTKIVSSFVFPAVSILHNCPVTLSSHIALMVKFATRSEVVSLFEHEAIKIASTGKRSDVFIV